MLAYRCGGDPMDKEGMKLLAQLLGYNVIDEIEGYIIVEDENKEKFVLNEKEKLPIEDAYYTLIDKVDKYDGYILFFNSLEVD